MRMLRSGLAGLLLAAYGAAIAGGPALHPAWKLTWADEFNAPDGSAPDPAKWSYDLGAWAYNQELESYTARPANIEVRGGNLVITAREEEYTGADRNPRSYTSARIHTEGKFSQSYGRVEARMQLPLGKGIWPAFWMLGADMPRNGWPAAGEIDVMENIGEPRTIYSTLHGPGYSGAGGISARFDLPAGEAVNTGFHVYAVEWAPGKLRFFCDGAPVAERTPSDLPAGAKWVYDHPFFLILNLAVGGAWPGNPDEKTPWPQVMKVDWVRVYSPAS